jgi:hypothetical protein
MKMNKRNNCFEEFFKVEFDESRIILDDHRNIEDYYCRIFSKKCDGMILKMLFYIFDEIDESNFKYLFRCVNFIFSVSEKHAQSNEHMRVNMSNEMRPPTPRGWKSQG